MSAVLAERGGRPYCQLTAVFRIWPRGPALEISQARRTRGSTDAACTPRPGGDPSAADRHRWCRRGRGDPGGALLVAAHGSRVAGHRHPRLPHPSTPEFGTSLRGYTNTLKLEAVSDLGATVGDNSLAGSEDAFALGFSASGPLEADIQSFSHPDLGVFELFIAPVEGRGAYEAVVNRSVGAPKHVPHAPRLNPGPAGPPKEAPKPAQPVPRSHVRRISARRVARGVVTEIAFNGSLDLKSTTVWLSRRGIVVASTSVPHVRGHRLAARLPMKRPRGGRYEVTVRTQDHHGHVEFKLERIVLQ
jgi:hypothetical protein